MKLNKTKLIKGFILPILLFPFLLLGLKLIKTGGIFIIFLLILNLVVYVLKGKNIWPRLISVISGVLFIILTLLVIGVFL